MKKILLLFSLWFSLCARADSWTQKASYPGSGLELSISFSIGDKGYAGCGAYASDFWEYDPVANSWTQKATLPGGTRAAGIGFSIGSKGYAGTGVGPLGDFWEFDPVANTWTAKAGLNPARSFATGFSIGNKGYVGCGMFPFMNDFWEYDPATNAWTQKANFGGTERCGAVGFSILGKGYITTGLNYYNPTNDMWEYDPAANTWTQKADLPAAGRSDARGFVICDKGYLMSGGQSPLYDDLWQFDPVLNQWTQKTNVPGGVRAYGASFVIDNKGYFGLGQLTGYFDTNDFWEYTPDDDCSTSVLNFSASDTTLCQKFCISYFDSSANNPTAWEWIFPGGDPSASTDQNPANICYDLPGTYDVTLITTSASGIDTLVLHSYITVYPTPPFPSITQVDYTLTSSLSSSYQWQFNTVNISGATNQSYNVLQTGLYTVIAGDLNGCVNSANQYVLISGIDEVSDGSISIYPDPSSGSFTVEWTNSQMPAPFFSGTSEVSIDVVNTLGQIVFSSQQSRSMGTSDWSAGFHSEKREIDLGDVARGVYFVEIKTENTIMRKKIVIAH